MPPYVRLLLIVLCLIPGPVPAQNEPPAAGDFILSEAGARQRSPAVAYDANNDRFLAVWTDLRKGDTKDSDIYGRILDARGEPVTGDIAISRANNGQAFAAVAFDSLNNRFLVVWTDWRNVTTNQSNIYGQLVNADGTLQGSEIEVSQENISQKFPAVAFDPSHGRFLVAWVDERGGNPKKIFGRYVNVDGRPQEKGFPLTQGGGKQDGPAVFFDGKRDRFLLLWRDTEENGIHGKFLTPGEGKVSAGFPIITEEARVLPPTRYGAAFDSENDQFFVAWTSRKNSAKKGMDVYGRLIDGNDGSAKSQPIEIVSEQDHQRSTSVSFDQKNSRFLVVWYDLRRTPTVSETDIYGRYVSTQGTPTTEFILSDVGADGTRKRPAIAYSSKSGTFLVLWEDGRKTDRVGRQVFGRIVTP